MRRKWQKIKIKLNYNIFFYCYRLGAMFFTLFVISKLTALGDYGNYSNGNFWIEIKNISLFFSSTTLMRLIFGFFKLILWNNLLLINILFNLISTYWILKLINKIKIQNKIWIKLILLLPSFTIWSSYLSKEMIYIILSCITLIYLLDIKNNQKLTIWNKIIFFVILYITLKFKIQYSLYWIAIVGFIFLREIFKKIKIRVLFYIVAVLIMGITFYILKDEVDIYFKNFHRHFDFGKKAEATRNMNLFKENYGFFKNMLYGMFISFYGPGLRDLFSGNFMRVAAYFESMVLFVLLSLVCVYSKKYYKGFFVLISFVTLLSHYPFGVFNSGAAVRYRTGLIIPLVALPYLLEKKRKNEVVMINGTISSMTEEKIIN